MKIIVCGAGQVGYNIARYLAGAGNDVTVIDQRPELTQKIGESLDIQAITGFASHPEVLEQAGAARRRAADRGDQCRRGQHGHLPDRALAVQRADQDRAGAPSELSAEPLAGSVPARAHADRRDHLARARGRARDRAPPRGAGRDRGDAVRRRSGAADRRALRSRLPDPRHAAAPADLPVPGPAPDLRRHHPRRPSVRAERRRPSDRGRRGLLGGRDQPYRPGDARLRPRGEDGRADRDRRRRQYRPVSRRAARGAALADRRSR